MQATKKNLGWPLEPPFYVPEKAKDHFHTAVDRGKKFEAEWDQTFQRYQKEFPDQAAELRQMIDGKLVDGWDRGISPFQPDEKGMATRTALGKVMNASAERLPFLIGGSADLDPSTYTALKDMGDFLKGSDPGEDQQGSTGGGWSYSGRNIHFGVREHAMGGIVNGLAAHGGLLPYSATFLIFSDYMRPPMRLASLMHLHVIFIFTHDSIGLGEDGPTHQPVEQLLGLRSIPGMTVIRPADANETAAAWRIAVEQEAGPIVLVLSRQELPVLDLNRYPAINKGVQTGGYILEDLDSKPDIVLVATGSEVHLVLEAQQKLKAEGITARVVSMPGWNLFIQQPESYRKKVLPPDVPALSIEAGTTLGWEPYFGARIDAIGVDRFGASAPGEVVMEQYGITVEHILQQVHTVINHQPVKEKESSRNDEGSGNIYKSGKTG